MMPTHEGLAADCAELATGCSRAFRQIGYIAFALGAMLLLCAVWLALQFNIGSLFMCVSMFSFFMFLCGSWVFYRAEDVFYKFMMMREDHLNLGAQYKRSRGY